MTPGEVLSLVPLILASLVPAILFVAAFLISRRRSQFLSVASFVTAAAAGLTCLAVFLRPVLSLFGFDARTKVPTSVMNDVVQLDLISSAMFAAPEEGGVRRKRQCVTRDGTRKPGGPRLGT